MVSLAFALWIKSSIVGDLLRRYPRRQEGQFVHSNRVRLSAKTTVNTPVIDDKLRRDHTGSGRVRKWVAIGQFLK